MTSKQTKYRQYKIQALKRMFILIYNLLHEPYTEIDKISINFLLKMELELKKYEPSQNDSERDISERYISLNDDDSTTHTKPKNQPTIKSRFDEVFK